MIPAFGFDPAIRKIIYTTDEIESLNRVIRKSIKTRGSFPTDEAATKLIYLATAGSGKTAGTSGNGLSPIACNRLPANGMQPATSSPYCWVASEGVV